MVKLRKGPVCQGTLSDGTPCEARVERPGDRCHVCLERLATSEDVESRRQLAADAALPASIFELLGADVDDDVRLAVARRQDCPLVVLQELEHDEHPEVRAAAGAGLSSAFAPRVLQEPAGGNLFTRAELDALGQQDAGTSHDPFEPPAAGRPSAAPVPGAPAREPELAPRHAPRVRPVDPTGADGLLAGIDEILSRLDALSTRLSSLESVLASTGQRLDDISDRLEGLGEAPPVALPPIHEVAAPAGSLLPVVHLAELGTGPVIRADVVAAAWLAVLPMLARSRGRGPRGPVALAHEPVAGPFAGGDAAIAELLPARAVSTVGEAEGGSLAAADPAGDAAAVTGPAASTMAGEAAGAGAAEAEALAASRRDARHGRRRHAAHAQRRGLRR